MTIFVVILIIITYIFTFINGIHDGCNVVATIISSRSMKPKKALFIASVSEFIFPVLMGTAVASTIGKGIVKIQLVQSGPRNTALVFILSALVGAIVWNIITWLLRLPSSSSHALIGGLIGSGIYTYGMFSIEWRNILFKVILMLFLTPMIGFITGIIFITLAKYFSNKFTNHINLVLKWIQTISMVFLAASHSTNDSQKSMGIVTLILIVSGVQNKFTVPFWVKITSSFLLALGLYLGGLRIVRTVGSGIFKLKPLDSFISQLSAAAVIFVSGQLGSPVSTSQIVSSSIMGVGAGEKFRSVKWDTVKKIFVSWVTTIPASAVISYITCSLIFLLIEV